MRSKKESFSSKSTQTEKENREKSSDDNTNEERDEERIRTDDTSKIDTPADG
jgi:hypothetical protein